MDHDYIECFAGLLIEEHQGMAEAVAMRRAQQFNHLKDFENCRAWLKIADRIRHMPRLGEKNRRGLAKSMAPRGLQAGAC